MRRILIVILITVAVVAPVTWQLARRSQPHGKPGGTASEHSGRKVLYYQSAMHPWIKSDKPGRCTICGMELTPIYEGDPGFGSGSDMDIVSLTPAMIRVLDVQTSEVKVRPLVKSLLFAGVIDDDATRHRILAAYTGGRIDKLYVNYIGAEVEAGQPLAEFYSPALLQAEREYRALKGEFRKKAALRLRQMGLNPEQIEALPNKREDTLTTPILAPMTGTVVGRKVFEGQYVEEGAELFEIADFSTMWFQFDVYENDLPWIKPGLPVEVTTPAHPGRVFAGKIAFIDPNVDELTRSTKVRVELENPIVEGRRLLLHRLYAEGRVDVDARETLTIPKAAVVQTGRDTVVYLEREPGQYERRVVTTGVRGDELIEVSEGLESGQRVVTHGTLLLDSQAEMNRAFDSGDGLKLTP